MLYKRLTIGIKTSVGLHPTGLQGLYLPSFTAEEPGVRDRNISGFNAAVPTLFGTRDWFLGRPFFPGWGQGGGSGGHGSNEEGQVKKHHLLSHCSPPAELPGS